MESHLSEESLWANALAARLKVLQANFADDDANTRQDFITQEIQQALKGTVPDKRKILLNALAERFPAAQAASSVVVDSAPAAPQTPEALLERLVNLAPTLSAEQRASFAQQLQHAGFATEKADPGFTLPPEVLKRIGLEGSASINTERGAKTFGMLIDMVLTLDQLVWTLWKQIAPRSVVRKEAEFAKLSGEYLSGSAEVSSAQVLQSLERTRRMIAGLLGGLGRAGSAYARERARLFDPTAIQAVAGAEKKFTESLEFACWRVYVRLCKEYGAEAAIEKGIQEALTKAAENLILGRPAN
jgi:hypothetical protein